MQHPKRPEHQMILVATHATSGHMPEETLTCLGRLSGVSCRSFEECLDGSGAIDLLVAWVPDVAWNGLAWVLATSRSLKASPEMVFITGSVDGVVRSALRAIGLRYVLPIVQSARWLASAVEPLARLARARRALRAAKTAVPPLPAPPPLGVDGGLFRAEQKFREVYLQALLGSSRTRAEAARRAKLPYRTLCNMISKLQVDVLTASSARKKRPRDAGLEKNMPVAIVKNHS
jgi:hypothetical protein